MANSPVAVRVLAGGAVVVALLLGGCGSAPTVAPENLPAQLQPLARSVPVEVLWTRRAGVGVQGRFLRLAPAFGAEKVYVADVLGTVLAYRAASGTPVWKRAYEVRVTGGVGYGDGLVLLGTQEGEVLALDAEDGALRWRTTLSSEVLSVPQIAAGKVVVQTNDGKVVALEAADGKRIWSFDTRVPVLSLRGTATALIDGGVVYAGFASGKLAAMDLHNGKALWEIDAAIPEGRSELQRMVDIDTAPLLVDGVLYAVSYQGRLVAVEAGSGRMLWTREMSSFAGMTVQGGQLYVTDELSHVWALDRSNGAALWKQDKLHLRGLTAPAVAGGQLVVGDFEGFLHLLSIDDGELVGRLRLEQSGDLVRRLDQDEDSMAGFAKRYVEDRGLLAPLLAVDGLLYAVTNHGVISALRPGAI